MKKGLIGCLVVGLLLLIVGGGLAYWFIARPMVSSASAGMDSMKELAKIGQANVELKNQVNENNVQLVRPHAEMLTKGMGSTMLGL